MKQGKPISVTVDLGLYGRFEVCMQKDGTYYIALEDVSTDIREYTDLGQLNASDLYGIIAAITTFLELYPPAKGKAK